MKKIIIDFETTNLSPFDAEILEFCAFFVENDKIIDRVVGKIKILKNWEEFSESDLSVLAFNKIYNSKDLEEHNLNSLELKKILAEFLEKVKMFSTEKIPLSGGIMLFMIILF